MLSKMLQATAVQGQEPYCGEQGDEAPWPTHHPWTSFGLFLLACGTWGGSQGAISLHTFAAVAVLVPVFPCHLAVPSCCPWPASGPGEGHGCVAQGLQALHDSTEKMRDRSEDISWALFFSPALATFWLCPAALTPLHH